MQCNGSECCSSDPRLSALHCAAAELLWHEGYVVHTFRTPRTLATDSRPGKQPLPSSTQPASPTNPFSPPFTWICVGAILESRSLGLSGAALGCSGARLGPLWGLSWGCLGPFWVPAGCPIMPRGTSWVCNHAPSCRGVPAGSERSSAHSGINTRQTNLK